MLDHDRGKEAKLGRVDVDGIGTREMIGLVVDFLAEPRSSLVSHWVKTEL